MSSLITLDLVAADAPPGAVATDHTGLVVLGVLVAAAFVAMWRVLLRLLLIALVALVFIGIGVLMTPAVAPSHSAPPTTSQAPAAAPDTQRAQTG